MIDQIQIKDALDIYVAQTGIVNTLWNIFLAVSLAILGYVYKDRTLMDDWKIKLGLTIGFPLFAFGNSAAILRSQTILVAVSNYLKSVPDASEPSFNQVLQSHAAIPVESIRIAHLLFTLLVLIAMWLPNIAKVIFSRKNKNETRNAA